jgi:hypothetical protein
MENASMNPRGGQQHPSSLRLYSVPVTQSRRTTSYLVSQLQRTPSPQHNPSYNSTIAASCADSEPPTYFEAVNGGPSMFTVKTKTVPKVLTQQPSIISSVPSTIATTGATNLSSRTTASNIPYEKPNDYLAWSIFTALYCIFIGVIALSVSLTIRRLNAKGKYQLAYTKSMLARNLNMCAVFFGFIYVTAGLLLFFVRRPF